MTPAEAYHVLQLEPGAGREQIERQFAEQKQSLREKRAKAHAPGLKAHIQQGLSRLDTAREVLLHREDLASGGARSRRGGQPDSLAGPAEPGVLNVTAAAVDEAVDRLPRRLIRHAEGFFRALLATLAGAGAGAMPILVSAASADHRGLWVSGGAALGFVPGILWWRSTVGRLRRDEWVKIREALARGEERPVAWQRPALRLALALLLLLAAGVGYWRWTPAAWPTRDEPALARVGEFREELSTGVAYAGESAGDEGAIEAGHSPIADEASVGAPATPAEESAERASAGPSASSPPRAARPAATDSRPDPVPPASSAPAFWAGAAQPGQNPTKRMHAATSSATPEIPGPAEDRVAAGEDATPRAVASGSAKHSEPILSGAGSGPSPTSVLLARVPLGGGTPGTRKGAPGLSPEQHPPSARRPMPPAAVARSRGQAARAGAGESEESRAGLGRAFHAWAVGLREAKRPGLALFALDQAEAVGRPDEPLAARLRQEFTDAQALTVWQAPPRAEVGDGSDLPGEAAGLAAVATTLDQALRDSLVPVLPALVTLERAEEAIAADPSPPLLLLRVEAAAQSDDEAAVGEGDADGSNPPSMAGPQRRTLRAQVVLISPELPTGEQVLLEVRASRTCALESASTADEEAASWAAVQADLRVRLQMRRLELLTNLAKATLAVVQAQRVTPAGEVEEALGDLEWGWFAVWTEAGLPLPQHKAERAARLALALPEAVVIGP